MISSSTTIVNMTVVSEASSNTRTLKCVNANMDKSFPLYITVCFHLIAANASGAAVLVRTYMFQISMTR